MTKLFISVFFAVALITSSNSVFADPDDLPKDKKATSSPGSNKSDKKKSWTNIQSSKKKSVKSESKAQGARIEKKNKRKKRN